nr:conotoxin precursor O1 [Conus ebraeus]UMA83135.1 conotoxin precursor O1 [Conus judaeus]UMA82831.1 conotoxin precursor O1 [Conus ebraeus]UMA83487.1 conotoxin precursor O1 [Conus judaeus]UMA83797.1 conotoxin precursor O1 [Conus judaeus]
MKLTCPLIVGLLFLSACQLTTTDDSRGRQGYHAVRTGTKMQNNKIFKLTKRCAAPGAPCSKYDNECCDACMLSHPNPPVCIV